MSLSDTMLNERTEDSNTQRYRSSYIIDHLICFKCPLSTFFLNHCVPWLVLYLYENSALSMCPLHTVSHSVCRYADFIPVLYNDDWTLVSWFRNTWSPIPKGSGSIWWTDSCVFILLISVNYIQSLLTLLFSQTLQQFVIFEYPRTAFYICFLTCFPTNEKSWITLKKKETLKQCFYKTEDWKNQCSGYMEVI